jgi:hypothetical protein
LFQLFPLLIGTHFHNRHNEIYITPTRQLGLDKVDT